MKNQTTAIARVKDGTLDLSTGQRENIARFLRNQEGKFCQLTIREQGKPRSLNQNAYLWVVYQMIADETGHDTEDVHEFCKMKFLPRQFVEIGDDAYSVAKSTTRLSSNEFGEYLDRVVAFASTELSIRIPAPNEA